MYIDKETDNIILWKCNQCERVVEVTKGKYLQVNILDEGNKEVIHKSLKPIKEFQNR